jgi:hypothetical protein
MLNYLLRYGAVSSRRKSNATMAHFDQSHHTLLALRKQPLQGYQTTRKKLDILYEYLDSCISHCTYLSRSLLLSSDKKSLDSITTIRDIYNILWSSGPDSILIELSRFKKNPRYLELISKCAEWCVDHGYWDTVVKISSDVFDWLEVRNRYILNFEGCGVILKKLHQKRTIFTDFKDYEVVTEERKSR